MEAVWWTTLLRPPERKCMKAFIDSLKELLEELEETEKLYEKAKAARNVKHSNAAAHIRANMDFKEHLHMHGSALFELKTGDWYEVFENNGAIKIQKYFNEIYKQ